jgi:PAS domain S-box-containing protein
MLRDYALFLKQHHLEAVAVENLRLVRALDVPLLRLFAHLTDDQLLQMTIAGMATFLTDLAEDRAVETAAKSLEAWEKDEMPGVPQDAIQPGDLVMVYVAQRQALMKFLPLYTSDVAMAMGIVNQLEAYYMQIQQDAFELMARLRQQAGEREATLRMEKETSQREAEELHAMNEELQSQQEELESLYDQLQQQNEDTEAEVRRRTEQLARSESRFRAVFDKAAVGMVIVNHAGRFSESNHALQAMLGYTAEELSARTFLDITAPEDLDLSRQNFEALMSGAMDLFQVEKRYRRKDETVIWGRLTLTPVRDEAGATLFAIAMIEDVTQRKEAEEAVIRQLGALRQANAQLRQVDRYKDEFLSVISHELRTPLNFITGFASILDDEVDGPLTPKQHLHLGKILAGSDRMLSLVNDLLDFAKLQAGKFDLSPEPTPYAPLVDDVVTSMRPLADHRGVTLETDVQVPMPPMLDGVRVVQVLTNLISNAVKFTGKGGTIRVSATVEDGALVTRVSDTGMGIAESDIPKLFNRFRQLDMSTTRAAGGTGLGLAISKALIEAHGGAIGVESAVGRGSTFWFRLPMEGAKPRAKSQRARH